MDRKKSLRIKRVRCILEAHGAVHLHYRRRGLLTREGTGFSGTRRASAGARLLGAPAQARPLSQRRSRHHEPLPARGGVRHRRRGGDRPRPRPLRALHRRAGEEVRQHHHGAHLPADPRQGAARRLPGRHRAGDPARDGCHQGVRALGQRGHRFRAGGDRRHGGRHRGPAVLRGHTPARQRAPQGRFGVHPPHPAALHPERGRAQDQADAALGEGAAGNRHPARHPAVPLRPAGADIGAKEDRAVLQRAPRCRDPGAGRCLHLRGAARLPPRRARRAGAGGVRHQGCAGAAAREMAGDLRRDRQPRGRGDDRHRRQVHGAEGRLQVAQRGAVPRRHRQQGARQARVDRGRGVRARGPGAIPRERARHPGARRLRRARLGGQDPRRPLCPHAAKCPTSASALACRWR